jgi:hypothetical protein
MAARNRSSSFCELKVGARPQPCPKDLLAHSIFRSGRFAQHPDRVLAMKAGYLNELVEDLFLFYPRSGFVPRRDRCDQFSPGCQTQLPPDSVPLHVESERVTFS